MNEYFQENKRSLLILAALLFLLAVVLYILLLHPLLGELSSKERAIASVEEEIELLQVRLENFEHVGPEIDIEQLTLEKKIPKDRDLDKYILSLQQLELTTNSKINQIQFVYDSNLDTAEEEEIEELEELEQIEEDDRADTGEEAEDEEDVDPTIDPEILNEKPDNLQVMTVKITAISSDYEDFIKLLKQIETGERISLVTNLRFKQPTEVDEYFLDNPLEIIPFDAELTTFYYTE